MTDEQPDGATVPNTVKVHFPVGALLWLLLLAWPDRSVAQAQAPHDKAALQALEIFFELGLPDTRGAKWVQVSGEEEFPSPIPTTGYGDPPPSGNAWLLKEHPNGEVDLVVGQARRMRAKKAKTGEEESQPGQLPYVTIEPADVEKDLAQVVKALAAASKNKSNPDDDEEDNGGGLQAYRVTLLFLAHLHRQGRTESAQKVLPTLLKSARSPELLLDSAMDLLAEARLHKLCDSYLAGGSAEEYAKGLDAVVAEFTRGWTGREWAQLLASRLRSPKPGATANEPLAQKAAQLLLSLKPQQIAELPIGRNWFLPGSESAAEDDGPARFEPLMQRARNTGRSGWTHDPPQKSAKAAANTAPAKPDAVAAFFANKREAAHALAQLLDDHRVLRVRFSSGDDRPNVHSFRGNHSSGTNQYEAIPRPFELGELADQILSSLYPQALQESDAGPEEKAPQVLTWLKEISAMSDEDLAWHYMREAGDADASDFRLGLSFLVREGGKESIAKLQEVFVDPAVSGSDALANLLEPYLQRLGDERGAFAARFEAAAKASIEAAAAAQIAPYGDAINDQIKKHFDGQKNEKLKRIAQLLHPRTYGEILEAIGKASDEEALEEVSTLKVALGAKLPAGAQTKIVQAAAKARAPRLRWALLGLLTEAESADETVVKFDETAREAWLVLLADDRVQAAESPWAGASPGGTIAHMAARLCFLTRLPEAEQAKWEELSETAPQLQPLWLRTHAIEFVKTGKSLPVPDASRVNAARLTALVAELSAAKPAEALAAFRARQPDEQLALVQHLEEVDAWPAALAAAHFTITQAESQGIKLDQTRWKGRTLDVALHTEILSEIEKSLLGGESSMVMIQSQGPLSGITITAGKSPGSMGLEELKGAGMQGLDGKPVPHAAVFLGLREGSEEGANPAKGYCFPLWKDAALTAAWKKEHLKFDAKPKPAASEKEEEGEERSPFVADPAGYQQALKEWLQLKPGQRGAVQIYIYASVTRGEAEEDHSGIPGLTPTPAPPPPPPPPSL